MMFRRTSGSPPVIRSFFTPFSMKVQETRATQSCTVVCIL
jgi:hypothetical protein